jgi:hypothetical protein
MQPVISAITTIRQGQGEYYLPKESVIEVWPTFTSTSSHACNFLVEISKDGGSTWANAVMHSYGLGQNLVPGAVMLVVDIRKTWNATGWTEATYTNLVKIRLTATDTVTSEVSSTFTSAAITVKASRPSLAGSPTIAAYIGLSQVYAAPYTIDGKDKDASESIVNLPLTPTNLHSLRNSTNVADLDFGSSAQFYAYSDTPTYAFATTDTDGPYTIYVRIYDQFFNASDLYNMTTYLQRTPPGNTVVKLVGTNGNSDYTGITVNADGSFTPNRNVTLNVGATSNNPTIPLYFKILDTSTVELTSNVGVVYPLTSLNATQVLALTTNRSAPSGNNFNTDVVATIAIEFSDDAGNKVQTSKTIRFNTRIYKSAQKPMRPQSSTYAEVLKYINTSGFEVTVPQTLILNTEVTRAWPDIFFPASHGYPLDVNGNLDVALVTTDPNLKNGLPTDMYDPIILDGTNVVYDSDGRPMISAWTQDGSKNYGDQESQDSANLRYWVLDNTGNGDFQVEFGFFDLDMTIFGPPRNPQAPYPGDVLVMYDATAPGCLSLVTTNGVSHWVLSDATKLVELAAYTGSGTNVVNLKTGQPVGASAKGEFLTDLIQNIPKVAFILYTDDSGTASGFQIKAAKGHDKIYRNYDVDTVHGEIWAHMHESVANSGLRGAADTTIKRLYYDYLPTGIDIGFSDSTITFNTAPPSGATIKADWSYYTSLNWAVRTFLAANDDHVAFYPSPVYAAPSGSIIPTPSGKTHLYEVDGYGRYIQHFTWDQDRGLVEFSSGYVPVGRRVVSDYYHHTLLRLNSDGFGDLVFHDKVLVPDLTPYFPDYTWADVKIVNEGNAEVAGFQVKFVPRGHDTNGDGNATFTGSNVVDQVLDINRPWDIQVGTKDETFDKMAMNIQPHYLFPRICPRTGGTGTNATAGATAILGTWKNRVYGTVAARSKAFGRVVWVLGGSGGSSYPAISAGKKRTSLEASGTYYASLII